MTERSPGEKANPADSDRAERLRLEAAADRAASDAEAEGSRWLPILGAGASFAWFGLYLYHLASTIGLANLLDQPLLDGALVILAFFAPPAFLWLLIGYVGRGRELSVIAARLQRQLQLLSYPDDEAGGKIDTIAAGLKRQSEDLRTASEAAAAALRDWRAKLADHTSELTAATAKADAETSAFQQQIDQQRRIFGDMQSALESQAAEISRHYAEAIAKMKSEMAGELSHLKSAEAAIEERYRQFEGASHRQIAALREAGAAVEQSLIQRGEAERAALRGSQAANEERFGALEAAFERQSRHLQHLIDDQAARLAQSIALFAERLQETAQTGADQFGQRVLELESRIGGVARAAGQDFQDTVRICNEAIERVAGALHQRADEVKTATGAQAESLLAAGGEMTQRVKAELDRQGEALRDLARDLANQIHGLTETAKGQAPVLERAAGAAATALGAAIARETNALDALAATLTEKADVLEEAIRSQRDRLGEVAAEAADGFKSLLGRQADEFLAAAEAVAAHSLNLEATTRKQREELMAAADAAMRRESEALAAAGAKATAELATELRRLHGEVETHFAGLKDQGTTLAREVEIQTIAFGKIAEQSAQVAMAMRESLTQQMAEAGRAGEAIGERARDMGRALERQAKELDSTLLGLVDRHVAQLTAASAAQAQGIADLSLQMRAILDRHAEDLARSGTDQAQRLDALAAEMQAKLDRQATHFAQLGAAQAESVAGFAAEMQANVDRQVAHFAAAAATQARQSGELQQALLRQSDSLNAAFADIATATTEMRTAMGAQIEALASAAQSVKGEAETMSSAFAAEAAALTEAAASATHSAARLQGELRSHFGEIDNIAEQAIRRLAVARSALLEESETFRNVSASGAESAAHAAGLYRDHALGLSEVGDLLRERLEQMSRALHAQAGQLATIGAQAMERQQQINVSLGIGIEQMARLGTENDQRLVALKAGLSDMSAGLRQAAGQAAQEIDAASGAFRRGAEAVGQATQAALGDMGAARQAMEGEIGLLGGLAARIAEAAATLKTELQGQSDRLTEAAALARASAEAGGQASRAVEERIAREIAALDQANARMGARLDELARNVATAIGAAASALDRSFERAGAIGETLTGQTGNLAAALTEAGETVDRLGSVFQARRQEMTNASAEALGLIEKLRALTAEETKGAFLRTASTMIDSLNAMAVDINGLIEADIPEDIWRKFRAGDRSIFARRLFRRKEAYDVPPVAERYRTDEAFRDLVDRYLRAFETLLTQSGRADPDSTLSAALLSADIGKLYLVLAKSTGRQQEN